MKCKVLAWGITLGIVGSLGCASVGFAEKAPAKFLMEVSLGNPQPQQFALVIRITNQGKQVREIEQLDLPWMPLRIESAVTITRLDATESVVPQSSPIEDYDSWLFRLHPGESIEGQWKLNRRFPTLLEDIKNFGVKIHWDCDVNKIRELCTQCGPTTLPIECSQENGGSFLIPKGDPGLPEPIAIDHEACTQLTDKIKLLRTDDTWEHLSIYIEEPRVRDLEILASILKQVEQYVRLCKPHWTSNWEVGFFNNPKFSGTLGEPNNMQHLKRGIWQKAEMGVYAAGIRRLVRFPWSYEDRTDEFLSLSNVKLPSKVSLQ